MYIGRAAVLIAVLTFGPAASGGPSSDGDRLRGHRRKAEIDALVEGLRSGRLQGAQEIFARDGGPYRVYTSYIEKRVGHADIHAQDDEIFLVLSGAADCTLGGDISDKTLVRNGEYRGTRIVGGSTSPVGPGDIISAPRGTAHQMDPGQGHILYVVIKVMGR
jgi:mannose-6-phosphate isomerase-like protein (cupin superfamily)